jgi:tetratricopeptide (TPR) repeat protein
MKGNIMKICPLVTQTTILEDYEKESLVLEAEENEITEEEKEKNLNDSDDENPFLNPEISEQTENKSDGENGEISAQPVRFVAKSYKGQVYCLGKSCRFYDDEKETCRFEELMQSNPSNSEDWKDEITSLQNSLGESRESHQKSKDDIIEFLEKMEEKSTGLKDSMIKAFEDKVNELKEIFSSATEENKVIIESISDIVAEKTEDLEDKIKEEDNTFELLRKDVSGWKETLDKNIASLESSIGKNKNLTEELSVNYSEIVKMVENQEKTLAEEEKKHKLSEAKRINNTGVMAYHNGQYEKAKELFNKAIKLDSTFTEAYNNLGLTYTETDEETKATEAFKKAIELNPDLSTTYNNLGYAFYRLESYSEAIEMYNEAINKSKDNSSAYTNLGNAYYKLDKIEEALEAWEKAIEIDPANEKAQRNLKRFHSEERERKEEPIG